MAQSGARILVVDDEPAIVRAVVTNLAKHGYRVESATSGKDALQQQQAFRPEAILLDLGLPDIDGTEVIRQIRKDTDTPIIVLSVRSSEKEKVAALDLGADDYLTKPFGVDELLARVRVALRHSARPEAGADPVARAGDIELNLDQHRVFVRGEDVHLTPTEFELLRALIAHPGKLLTDRMLLQTVWGPEYGDEAHYLHVYVARLRRKIEPDPRQPRYLVTEPGVGYRLAVND
jgi:two-component system, OmpR family, KDP operon response regulator KdpE